MKTGRNNSLRLKAILNVVFIILVILFLVLLFVFKGSMNTFVSKKMKEQAISQATVSQHLKVLKQSGLICGNIEPPKVRYCIDKGNWEKAQHLFWDFLTIYPGK